ncbi:MAG: NAD(P)H-flavin reductase [Verrucomicrobiaceae bacterium]|nr:NAD(P)H-flavin reductase [Verrucomicrobiaceae bacterium]
MDEVFTISLPSGISFTAQRAENLLSAAQRANWLVRYGCRNGNCEACEAQLLSGCVLQRAQTIDASTTQQKILLCQCVAQSNLGIALNGNPLHGSAELARRSYAQLKKIDRIENYCALEFHLPAGRLPALHLGQYAAIETNTGNIRGYFDILDGRTLRLIVSNNTVSYLTPGNFLMLRYPLGYCYCVDKTRPILIVASTDQWTRASRLTLRYSNATLIQYSALATFAKQRFSSVFACTDNPLDAEIWYRQLLVHKIAFTEFCSDEIIRYRWRVVQTNGALNRNVIQDNLDEADASKLAAVLQRDTGYQSWIEPMIDIR